jgi:hypothetical protein
VARKDRVNCLLVPFHVREFHSGIYREHPAGLLVGTSSGANVSAALNIDNGRNRVVTALPDRSAVIPPRAKWRLG